LKNPRSPRQEIILGLIAVAAYIVCIVNDFHTDDWIVLSLLRDGFSFSDFLSMENPGRFRPLTNVLLYIRYLVLGDKAFLYYSLNIILHALVTVSLYRLLLKIDMPKRAAFISSLFFAVYFQHYEAVIWLYGIIREFAAIFYIACLWQLHDFISGGEKKSLLAFGILCFAGLFVVEDFVVAPLTFIFFAAIMSEHGERLRNSRPTVLIGVVSLIIYFSLRELLIARPGIVEQHYYPGLHMIRVLFDYLGWFVIPSPTHPYFSPLASSLDAPFYLAWRGLSYAAMVGFIPLSIWLYVKSPRPVRFFIIFMYVALLPILPLNYKVSSRNIYLPSIGLTVATGWLFYRIFWTAEGRSRLKRIGTAIIVALVVVNMAAVVVASREYYRTQKMVDSIVDDMQRMDVDFNACQYVLLDHLPGRVIVGPAMIYRLHFRRALIASNDPLRGPIDIESKADSLYNEGVPILVFDYRQGHMVDATEEYISIHGNYK
jgi:hypothetical protein